MTSLLKTFASLLCKTNRFHVAVRLLSNRTSRRQNVVRTSVTHSAAPRVLFFLFLAHFDVICDPLLNLFVNWYSAPIHTTASARLDRCGCI